MGSLHQCLEEKRYHQFIYLVKLKSNLDELDDHLHTPLIKLCKSMDNLQMACKLIKLLIANGASGDVVDEEGLSPLHIACKNNSLELAKGLLRHLPDCPVNATDMYGNTPLHYAASHEETDLVNILIPMLKRYQVNTDCRNSLGFTPLLIAASNGRLEVARYIAEKSTASTVVYDSLYFTSLNDWFHIYFDWPSGSKILSPSTPVTTKDVKAIRLEKDNLVPVNTRPAVNSMLDTYSRESSAHYSHRSHSGRAGRIPRIVVTQPSSDNMRRRANTAPINKGYKPSYHKNPLNTQPKVRDGWITLNTRNITQTSSKQEAWTGGGRKSKEALQENELTSQQSRSHDKANESYWTSMVELANICSEQLSDAYRKTITPTWPASPTDNDESQFSSLVQSKISTKAKDGSRAASILLGMIGKTRRVGSEASTIADDEQLSPKANLKSKLLKFGLKKAGERRIDDEDETPEDRERNEKAAAILSRVMNPKKKPQPKQTPLPTQPSLPTDISIPISSS